MRFPMRLRHNGKGRVLVTLYKRPGGGYRAYWRSRRTDGRPRTEAKEFRLYAKAKEFADAKVKQLVAVAKGLSAPVLAEQEASDARAAIGVLRQFYQDGGERLSLNDVAIRYCEAARKLGKTLLADAIDGYLTSVVAVKRSLVGDAISQFIAARATKTVPRDGKRPQLSPEHAYNSGLWLKEFAKVFPPPTCICDLSKRHLDLWMGKFSGVSAKTRNERRGVIKMFLNWCVERDYLVPAHRLLEAGAMKHEASDPDEIELFQPNELRALLEHADKALRPIIALAGLAGLREREAMRLDWQEDVFRVQGQIEVKAGKSKTRSRRLVEICPALEAWLLPYRNETGPLWGISYGQFHARFKALRQAAGVPARRNGLRHSYISSHFAVHSDEGLTAKLAGNSPDMIHRHYKGLLTGQQGAEWFAVAPAVADNVVQLPSNKAK